MQSTHMWKHVLIPAVLLNMPLAYADDSVPTAENWQTFGHTKCSPDPNDDLKLTPIIFAPDFETIQEPNLPQPVTELILRPATTKDNGEVLRAHIFERLIPDMRTLRYKRQVKGQHIGFINPKGQFVDEFGKAISENNPPYFFKLDDQYESTREILWERRDNPSTYNPPEGLQTFEGRCHYHDDHAKYETFTQRVRYISLRSRFTCQDEGGYSMAQPHVSERLEKTGKIARERQLTLWDHLGTKHEGEFRQIMTLFSELGDEECLWQKAELPK